MAISELTPMRTFIPLRAASGTSQLIGGGCFIGSAFEGLLLVRGGGCAGRGLRLKTELNNAPRRVLKTGS